MSPHETRRLFPPRKHIGLSGSAPSSRDLHECLRAAADTMNRAQSYLAYLDAKERFDDVSRKLAEVMI